MSAIYRLQNGVRGQLHAYMRRCLNQRRRNQLKVLQRAARTKTAGVLAAWHGRYSPADLLEELRSRIPEPFEILMVHSAFDRMLPMFRGTPRDVVATLLDFCGAERTLAMPAFVLGGRLYDKAAYFASRPFLAQRTPSEMGIISEVFRRSDGVHRSLHPTHSICAHGLMAESLTSNHHLSSTRAGPGTPFDFMSRHRTIIAGIGVEFYRCLAHTHTAEDTLGHEFPIRLRMITIPVRMVGSGGCKFEYQLTMPDGSAKVDNTLLWSLLSRDELREWSFHGTAMFATEARLVTDRLIAAARRGVTVFDGGAKTARKRRPTLLRK